VVRWLLVAFCDVKQLTVLFKACIFLEVSLLRAYFADGFKLNVPLARVTAKKIRVLKFKLGFETY
jgi:hypothetical protein